MSALPKMKPCPHCGHENDLGVYTYDSGATYVECSMDCGYRGPACTTARWAVRHHNRERDNRARRHLTSLKDRAETAEAALSKALQERDEAVRIAVENERDRLRSIAAKQGACDAEVFLIKQGAMLPADRARLRSSDHLTGEGEADA